MNMDFASFDTTELVAAAVVGVLLLFAGLRIKKVAFFVLWFLIGFWLMGYAMPVINDNVKEVAESQLWQTLLPIAGGLLLALMGFTIEKICVAGVAFGMTMVVTVQYFGTEAQVLAIGAVVAVVAATVATRLIKPATVLITALGGASNLTMCLLTWIPAIDKNVFYFPILIGLAVVGSIVQFMTSKNVH